MKLAIDLQSCQTDSRDRGIGRYVMSLTSHIVADAATQDEVVLLLDSVDEGRLKDLRGQLRRQNTQAPTATFGYPAVANFTDMHPTLSNLAGLLKSKLVVSTDADVLLVTSFFEQGSIFTSEYDWDALNIPKAVIAYDLIPKIFPERYLPEGNILSELYLHKLEKFKKFDLFLAISEATKRDLINYLEIDPDRIVVIGAGLDTEILAEDECPHAEQDALLASMGIAGDYVLMVGNADWRKNSMGALKAFAALPEKIRNQYQLVFTRIGEDVNSALSGNFRHVADRVVVAGNVSEKALRLLYRRCKVFLFPSFYEGFGLPVLEAMALGAPVLTSNLGALPEVVPNAVGMFDPRNGDELTQILQCALEDQDFRETLLAGAQEHAHSFLWDKCSVKAMEALRDLVPHHRQAADSALRWDPSSQEIECMAEAVLFTQAIGGESKLRSALESIVLASHRRILVDITEVVRLDARTGIQRVVRNYCAGLIQLAADLPFTVEPIIWTDEGVIHARSFSREHLGAACEGDDGCVEVMPNDIVFMVDSSWWLPRRFEAFHRKVRAEGGEIIWMVYDLVPILTPQFCDPGMPPLFREWLDYVSETADGCICISRATQIDYERYLDAAPQHASRTWTKVVHLGSDLESKKLVAPSEFVQKIVSDLNGVPWAVALGTIEPRKDYRTILKAFEQLWAEGIDMALVIIGKKGWSVEELAKEIQSHKENGRRLFWLEKATDGDVQYVLEHAGALIQASLAEGFGLPIVEAGSKGLPLLLSDIPVFHEIAGSEAMYFPVQDHAALARLLAESAQWLHPVRIRTLTWQESTKLLASTLLDQSIDCLEEGVA